MSKNQTYGVVLMVAKGAKIDDEIQFLMTRRRNTYAFGDFVHGRYINQTSRQATLANLAKMFNYMTLDEKKAIRTNDFTIVWYMYWNTIPERTPSTLTEKQKFDDAKRIFQRLIAPDNGAAVANLINQSSSISCIDMFEFPKGRKGPGEAPRAAAERELVEETNFNKNFFMMYDAAAPFTYTFTGKDDGQKYLVNYYVGEIIVPRHEAHVSFHQWRQLMEVSEVRLFNLRTIRELFPEYVALCKYSIAQYRHFQENHVEIDMRATTAVDGA